MSTAMDRLTVLYYIPNKIDKLTIFEAIVAISVSFDNLLFEL